MTTATAAHEAASPLLAGDGMDSTLTKAEVSSTDLHDALQKQLEYYFSRDNLAQDAYLVSQMNADLYVPIATVASFKMVRSLTENIDLVVDVLKRSPLVQVDEEGKMVRPVASLKRTTLILRDVADNTTEEEIKEFLGNLIGCSAPSSVRPDIGNTWFVQFTSESDVVAAHSAIVGAKFKGKAVRARVKSENLLRSSPFTSKMGLPKPFYPQSFPFGVDGEPMVGAEQADQEMYPLAGDMMYCGNVFYPNMPWSHYNALDPTAQPAPPLHSGGGARGGPRPRGRKLSRDDGQRGRQQGNFYRRESSDGPITGCRHADGPPQRRSSAASNENSLGNQNRRLARHGFVPNKSERKHRTDIKEPSLSTGPLDASHFPPLTPPTDSTHPCTNGAERAGHRSKVEPQMLPTNGSASTANSLPEPSSKNRPAGSATGKSDKSADPGQTANGNTAQQTAPSQPMNDQEKVAPAPTKLADIIKHKTAQDVAKPPLAGSRPSKDHRRQTGTEKAQSQEQTQTDTPTVNSSPLIGQTIGDTDSDNQSKAIASPDSTPVEPQEDAKLGQTANEEVALKSEVDGRSSNGQAEKEKGGASAVSYAAMLSRHADVAENKPERKEGNGSPKPANDREQPARGGQTGAGRGGEEKPRMTNRFNRHRRENNERTATHMGQGRYEKERVDRRERRERGGVGDDRRERRERGAVGERGDRKERRERGGGTERGERRERRERGPGGERAWGGEKYGRGERDHKGEKKDRREKEVSAAKKERDVPAGEVKEEKAKLVPEPQALNSGE